MIAKSAEKNVPRFFGKVNLQELEQLAEWCIARIGEELPSVKSSIAERLDDLCFKHAGQFRSSSSFRMVQKRISKMF